MQTKKMALSMIPLLLGVFLVFPGHAETFDYLVGADSPEGGVRLVRKLHVPAGSIISGVEFFTNEIETSFPRVTILKGESRRLMASAILAELKEVRSSGQHRVRVQCRPIAIKEDTSILVAIELPKANGVRGKGDGVGIAARELAGPLNSYMVSGRNGALGEMEMEFAIELIFDRNSKARQDAPGGDSQVGLIPLRTFLRAGHGLSGSAVIEFGLQQGVEVRLSIFDVMGRLVRNIEEGQLPAGTYTRSWNGRSNTGSRVAQGVYLIRLVAGEKMISQKVILTR